MRAAVAEVLSLTRLPVRKVKKTSSEFFRISANGFIKKNCFRKNGRRTNPPNSAIIETLPKGVTFSDPLKSESSDSHNTTFGVVYANDLARAEIAKENPAFPVGSIFVREKNETAMSETPQTVIAMVKREKGFSEKTGDWEFFVFDGERIEIKLARNRWKLRQLSHSDRKNRLGFQRLSEVSVFETCKVQTRIYKKLY